MSRFRRVPLLRLLLAAGVLATGLWPLAAQEQTLPTDRSLPTLPTRVKGVVRDLDREPIAGATVVLHQADLLEEGPATTTTDDKGRWSLLGLAPGRWEITIKARDYRTSKGWVMVADSGPTPLVEVRLRPLAEVSPSFYEGNPGTIVAWIETGNDLLDQGHPRAAREEYEKALRVMPSESQPEVLRAVARSYYLENDVDRAVLALKRALLIAPSDHPTRQLFIALLEEIERRQEADDFLAELDLHGPEAMSELEPVETEPQSVGSGVSPPPEVLNPPTVAPEAGRVGRFRTAFSEPSPLSRVDHLLERVGVKEEQLREVERTGGRYELAEESFYVYVPEDYRTETPYGLLVWVSPTPFGGFTRNELQEVLKERRLIWIGADNAGNTRPSFHRLGLALDAAQNMMALYTIDPNRVYIGGYSGGGRISSGLAMLFPDAFRGGLSIYGCEYFEPMPIPDRPGSRWLPRFPAPPKKTLRLIKHESRFVLLTGEFDFNRARTRIVYERMVDDGFKRVTYLQVPGASHYDPPGREWMHKAFESLDAPVSGSLN